jgi:hypothetical protein
LGRLYDVLLSTYPAEIEANRALYLAEEVEHERDPSEWTDESWKERHDGLRPLKHAINAAEEIRRNAYFELLHAVIAAHGGGTPWASEWYMYGTAHRVVRVGDRVYSICADYDADWPDNDHYDAKDDDGMVVLSVIEL